LGPASGAELAHLRPTLFLNRRTFRFLRRGFNSSPIFLATVKGTGANGKNNLGLWRPDSDGVLGQLPRNSDELGDYTVKKFSMRSSVARSPQHPAQLQQRSERHCTRKLHGQIARHHPREHPITTSGRKKSAPVRITQAGAFCFPASHAFARTQR
jgi:hypothetical protein